MGKIRNELIAIKEASHDGLLHPTDVVEWAKDHPRSALHRSLEWNDAVAAHEYRVWQVRQLIKVHVVSEDGKPEVVSLSIDRQGHGGYRDVKEVLASRQLTEYMLQDALAELERVQRRYNDVKELAVIWEHVAAVRSSRRTKRDTAEQHHQAG